MKGSGCDTQGLPIVQGAWWRQVPASCHLHITCIQVFACPYSYTLPPYRWRIRPSSLQTDFSNVPSSIQHMLQCACQPMQQNNQNLPSGAHSATPPQGLSHIHCGRPTFSYTLISPPYPAVTITCPRADPATAIVASRPELPLPPSAAAAATAAVAVAAIGLKLSRLRCVLSGANSATVTTSPAAWKDS